MKRELHDFFKTKRFKKGSYSTVLIIIAAAIIVAVNFMVNKLPTNIKNIDISDTKIYSIGSVTENVIENIESDVDIIVLADKDSVDTRISTLLSKYDDASKHINVTYTDPALYPSALTTYDTEENNIVVKCDETDKSEVISFDDIILYDQNYYYYYGTYYETEFDGEGQITSALDYVSNDNNKIIYTMTGHSETDLGSNVSELIDKSNFDVSSVNLLTDNGIPEDCDILICNQPTKDLADDELEMLQNYLQSGGNLILLLADTTTETPNLDTLMSDYGISKVEGYIADQDRYYNQNLYNIFPVYSSGDITSDFASDDYSLIYGSLGLSVSEVEGVTTDEFLTTSSNGMAIVSEEDYSSGQYTLAVHTSFDIDSEEDSEEDTEEDTEDTVQQGNFTVYACSTLIADDLTSYYTNLSNLQVFVNSITVDFDDVTNISIEPVSLETTYNTIAKSSTIGGIFIGLIPVVLLVFGFIRWMKRRKL